MSFGTKVCCVALLSFLIAGTAVAASERDAAVRSIDDCFRTDLKGKRCTPAGLEYDGKALLSLYKSGDRSVLPPLIRLGTLNIGLRALDGFYTETILADTNDFLTALSVTMTNEPHQNSFLSAQPVAGKA